MISLSRLLERDFGVHCNDEKLLIQALTHRSAAKRNNERMEFLGDAVLGMVIANDLYASQSELSEGQLTRARARIVKRESLASAGRRMNIGQFLVLGAGELRSGGRDRDSIVADAMEAIFAAVYLQNGLADAERLIRGALDVEIKASIERSMDKDPKTALQEYLQAHKLELPQYSVTDVQGQDHQQQFFVECSAATLDTATSAVASTRRQAEQSAAAQALRILKERTA